MSELDLRITRLLNAYADSGVRPLDPHVVAHGVSGRHGVAIRVIPAISPSALRWLALTALLAVVGAALLVAGAGRAKPTTLSTSKDLLVAVGGHIHIVDQQGVVTDIGVGSSPAWSMDQSIVAFDDGGRLIAVDRAAGTRQDLGLDGSGAAASFLQYDSITISADGRWILLGSGHGAAPFILVDRVTGLRSTLLYAAWKDTGIPAWSPAQDLAVAATDRGQLLVIDSTTSPVAQRIVRDRVPGEFPGGVAFGPNDRIAFLAGGGIHVIGADGRGERVLLAHSPAPGALLGSSAWSADGSTLAFSTWGGGGRIGLIDVGTGNVSYLPPEPNDTYIVEVGWTADGQLRVVTLAARSGQVADTVVQWLASDGSVESRLDLGTADQQVAALAQSAAVVP